MPHPILQLENPTQGWLLSKDDNPLPCEITNLQREHHLTTGELSINFPPPTLIKTKYYNNFTLIVGQQYLITACHLSSISPSGAKFAADNLCHLEEETSVLKETLVQIAKAFLRAENGTKQLSDLLKRVDQSAEAVGYTEEINMPSWSWMEYRIRELEEEVKKLREMATDFESETSTYEITTPGYAFPFFATTDFPGNAAKQIAELDIKGFSTEKERVLIVTNVETGEQTLWSAKYLENKRVEVNFIKDLSRRK